MLCATFLTMPTAGDPSKLCGSETPQSIPWSVSLHYSVQNGSSILTTSREVDAPVGLSKLPGVLNEKDIVPGQEMRKAELTGAILPRSTVYALSHRSTTTSSRCLWLAHSYLPHSRPLLDEGCCQVSRWYLYRNNTMATEASPATTGHVIATTVHAVGWVLVYVASAVTAMSIDFFGIGFGFEIFSPGCCFENTAKKGNPRSDNPASDATHAAEDNEASPPPPTYDEASAGTAPSATPAAEGTGSAPASATIEGTVQTTNAPKPGAAFGITVFCTFLGLFAHGFSLLIMSENEGWSTFQVIGASLLAHALVMGAWMAFMGVLRLIKVFVRRAKKGSESADEVEYTALQDLEPEVGAEGSGGLGARRGKAEEV